MKCQGIGALYLEFLTPLYICHRVRVVRNFANQAGLNDAVVDELISVVMWIVAHLCADVPIVKILILIRGKSNFIWLLALIL